MGCTGSSYYSYEKKKCISIENYKVMVENNIHMRGEQYDKAAEQMGLHLKNIGLPVLAVFCVLLGVAVTVYCAHLVKVKLARALTQEQYLSNYSNMEMNAESKSKATSTAIVIDRRDQAIPKGEDLGFSQYPATQREREGKGEGVSNV